MASGASRSGINIQGFESTTVLRLKNAIPPPVTGLRESAAVRVAPDAIAWLMVEAATGSVAIVIKLAEFVSECRKVFALRHSI